MKRQIIIIALSLYTITTWSQNKSIILLGKGNINVEKLNGHIDTSMDISNLSISELRVLRNAFAAQKGYAFKDGTLRAIYRTTTWYDSTMYNRWEKEECLPNTPPLTYSKRQTDFFNRLKAREQELLKHNFTTKEGEIVNVDNIINPFQLEPFDDVLKKCLAKNGFAITQASHSQLFQLYEKNDYCDFPNFVTTDLYLQLYHIYFDAILRDIEEQKLLPAAIDLCERAYGKFTAMADNQQYAKVKDAVEWCQAYFAIALQIMTGKNYPVAEKYRNIVTTEVANINSAQNNISAFIGGSYDTIMFPYSLFRPRGHYTRSDAASLYFKGMMWLQTAPMETCETEHIRRAILIAEQISSDNAIKQSYQNISQPITYLMGMPDNITITQVYDEWHKTGKDIADNKAMEKLGKVLKAIGEKQTRIRPKFENSCPIKINLMPQRYQPDAEAMLEMIDIKSKESKRHCPKGLDVMAAMSVSEAERILINELKEADNWNLFPTALDKAKKVMTATDWSATTSNRWLESLKVMNDSDYRHPYFMKTNAWKKKNLNTALASWAELKHDAVLYAKQPMAAECGGGGPENPVVKGYVEPNLKFWNKAYDLIQQTEQVIKRFGLETQKVTATTARVKELCEFCRNIAVKELEGKEPTNAEYAQIEVIGSIVENISLDLVREKDQYLDGWDNVTSTDKKVAVVTDVFTANGMNVSLEKHSILYEAVGMADDIYVVVEIGGMLYLTRGAVFSYREFQQASSAPRLTDEEWQKQLKDHPRKGVPSWMDEIIAPLKQQPTPNEEVFYSSGC